MPSLGLRRLIEGDLKIQLGYDPAETLASLPRPHHIVKATVGESPEPTSQEILGRCPTNRHVVRYDGVGIHSGFLYATNQGRKPQADNPLHDPRAEDVGNDSGGVQVPHPLVGWLCALPVEFRFHAKQPGPVEIGVLCDADKEPPTEGPGSLNQQYDFGHPRHNLLIPYTACVRKKMRKMTIFLREVTAVSRRNMIVFSTYGSMGLAEGQVPENLSPESIEGGQSCTR